jgi:hypothetical protein
VATPQPAGSTFAPHSFDTVIDTFGLCSCEDPVGVSVSLGVCWSIFDVERLWHEAKGRAGRACHPPTVK